MEVRKFFDDSLSHLSYAVKSKNKIVLVDPGRDPAPYYEYAREQDASIDKIILTHTHADFVAGHLELNKKTGADILCHPDSGAHFEFIKFSEGDQVKVGEVNFIAYDTPGHSEDSISVLASDEKGNPYAFFTGDTLFVGDVGRPDFPLKPGMKEEDLYTRKDDLARRLYQSLRHVFINLDHNVKILPTHSGGSLCGSNISEKKESTLKDELNDNWALQNITQDEFINNLLTDQPHVPAYFMYDREINKAGAEDYQLSLGKVPKLENHSRLDPTILTVDVRSSDEFQSGHLANSINLMVEESFETWLGTFVKPGQNFYVTGGNREIIDESIAKICKIGYENAVNGTFLFKKEQVERKNDKLDQTDFDENRKNYTIIDVRTPKERKEASIFETSLSIPLDQLEQKVENLHVEKPVVVHCSGGYRSAIATSILGRTRPDLEVYDLGAAVESYK